MVLNQESSGWALIQRTIVSHSISISLTLVSILHCNLLRFFYFVVFSQLCVHNPQLTSQTVSRNENIKRFAFIYRCVRLTHFAHSRIKEAKKKCEGKTSQLQFHFDQQKTGWLTHATHLNNSTQKESKKKWLYLESRATRRLIKWSYAFIQLNIEYELKEYRQCMLPGVRQNRKGV